jgi:hypothetical protein
LPSPSTKSASLSEGIVAVWNVLLYHVLSDHAKSLYDSGPDGKGIDGRGIENTRYECISSESGLFFAIAFSKKRIIPVNRIRKRLSAKDPTKPPGDLDAPTWSGDYSSVFRANSSVYYDDQEPKLTLKTIEMRSPRRSRVCSTANLASENA